MGLLNNYTKRQIAGETILIPTGEMAAKFNGIISMNETAELILSALEDDLSEDEIIEKITEEFEVDDTTARADLEEFVNECRKAGIIR